ncbi:unnamed protein product [Microthlaspi erraticum]|uniref:Uncharacterized protein n=1 Tax=Microthlaspi erraticum TaxID=1685480 RepID=A0A6D2KXV0_9BRAS|nr:unnamed protein product [Microthlaspi erraticum]
MPHTLGSAAELPLPRKSTHTNLERSGGSAVRDLSTSESYSTYGPYAPPCFSEARGGVWWLQNATPCFRMQPMALLHAWSSFFHPNPLESNGTFPLVHSPSCWVAERDWFVEDEHLLLDPIFLDQVAPSIGSLLIRSTSC